MWILGSWWIASIDKVRRMTVILCKMLAAGRGFLESGVGLDPRLGSNRRPRRVDSWSPRSQGRDLGHPDCWVRTWATRPMSRKAGCASSLRGFQTRAGAKGSWLSDKNASHKQNAALWRHSSVPSEAGLRTTVVLASSGRKRGKDPGLKAPQLSRCIQGPKGPCSLRNRRSTTVNSDSTQGPKGPGSLRNRRSTTVNSDSSQGPKGPGSLRNRRSTTVNSDSSQGLKAPAPSGIGDLQL